MSTSKITLYIDIVSPFAYLAFYLLQNSSAFKKCQITYVPALLAGIMKETGNRPPLVIKNKAEYINKERLRWASYLNIPICDPVPEGFPARTLDVQRILCATQIAFPDRLSTVIAELYRLLWVERRQAQTAEEYLPVLERVLGAQGKDKVLAIAAAQEGKDALTENTSQAVESGAFGMPWFVVTNSDGQTETFWGVDHIGQVMHFLGLERGNFTAML